MDTRYSFLNETIQGYMENDNDILIEYYIVKAVSFNECIYGTTAVIADASTIFGERSLKKNNSKSELEHGKHMNYSGKNIRRK